MKQIPQKPRPHGFWTDKENIRAELKRYVDRTGQTECMPSEDELRAAGHSSLAIAITHAGGFPVLAKEFGYKPRRRPNGHYDLPGKLAEELLAFVSTNGSPGVMPTMRQLKDAGRGDLVAAICRITTVRDIAKRLGLKITHEIKSHGHYDSIEAVGAEVRTWIKEHGSPGRMPTPSQLMATGNSGLGAAIQSHGGFPRVAVKLGLVPTTKGRGYWTVKTIDSEVLLFVAQCGADGEMPTGEMLRRCNRMDLENAIARSGGARPIAKRLGLKMRGGKEDGFWTRATTITELKKFVDEVGEPGTLPTQETFRRMNRHDLINAIHRRFGGLESLARELKWKLSTDSKPRGYWKDFGNLTRGIEEFIRDSGQLGQMPSKHQLLNAGQVGIAYAIEKHFGGYPAVAERLGLAATNLTLWPRSEFEIVLAHELHSLIDFDLEAHKVICAEKKMDVDIVLGRMKTVLEFDSRFYHRNCVDKDRRKSAILRREGWTVIRAREDGLALTHPHDVQIPSYAEKEAVNAIVRKLSEVWRVSIPGASHYLRKKKLVNRKAAQQYIADLLAKRRGKCSVEKRMTGANVVR